MRITQPVREGDLVVYYIERITSLGIEMVRRTGTVQGRCDGKVIVLHSAQYTELIPEEELFHVV